MTEKVLQNWSRTGKYIDCLSEKRSVFQSYKHFTSVIYDRSNAGRCMSPCSAHAARWLAHFTMTVNFSLSTNLRWDLNP
jgi:hypothetical protein